MLYVFEMANNHQGSVDHAKKIVDKFGNLSKKYKLNAAIKLQFRQLGTFIHKDYHKSDLKYVKRFNETKLSKSQFKEIVEYIKDGGMKCMATPFDNESLSWFNDLDIDIVKIASCSIDDWPLLEEVSQINKKIIISTAGAHFDTLKKVYRLFKTRKRDFAFMHCVGEYPTLVENSNLNRIQMLQDMFQDIEIGFSTHESPESESVTPYAVSMGCTIIEKHVGVPTDTIKLNAYSCTADQIEGLIKKINVLNSATNPSLPYHKRTFELESLKNLKRGVYVNKNLKMGSVLSRDDLYFAMPVQKGQLDASDVYDIIGCVVQKDLKMDEALYNNQITSIERDVIISDIKEDVFKLLENANVSISKKDKMQLSAHYGLGNFRKTGCTIVDKVNREYCKKILVLLPNQSHPIHHHIKKEETFELLSGDCTLNLNGRDIGMVKGEPKIIFRGVKHSFKSKNGCVVEEISTTHHLNDSIYTNTDINKLKLSDRKINIKIV
tara:strand:+ start:5364 stop:6842 length:1479 start_codon:yes stop_codon:yes gene_type:complete